MLRLETGGELGQFHVDGDNLKKPGDLLELGGGLVFTRLLGLGV